MRGDRVDFPSCLLAFVALASPNFAQEKGDLEALTADVHAMPIVGTPGPFAVFGEKSFAVVVGSIDSKHRGAAIAAARSGSGRVMLWAHEGYASADALHRGDMLKLAQNCVHWLAPKKDKPKVGAQGEGWKSAMKLAGFDERELAGDAAFDKLDDVDVICIRPLDLSDHAIDRVREFAKRGGGVLGADLGWGWQQVRPNLVLAERPAQRWLVELGLSFTTSYLGPTNADGFAVDGAPNPVWNAWKALDVLVANASDPKKSASAAGDELDDAAWSVMFAIRAAPDANTPFKTRLDKLVREHANELAPTEANPLKKDKALLRALLAVQLRELDALPSTATKAHASAADFPGVATGEAVMQTIDVDCAVPDWHSTGLYANAGARIVVQLPSNAKDAGLSLRIGCHTDELWDHEAWTRLPSISRSFALKNESTTCSSSYGGLVYVEVPRGSNAGKLHVVIRGANAAPRFVLGETDLGEWKKSIRTRTAPWAELESKKLIVSLPSKSIRELDDPAAVMEFWDRVLDAEADLATISRTRARPERFVCDRDISAGYMHSGYPIMMFLDAPAMIVDVAKLSVGENLWGFVHELGHNHQDAAWTFEGTGEVTNNLFSVYAIESCCKLPDGKRGHGGVENPPSVAEYVKRGAKFDEWKSDPFLALQMYLELQEAFGWDAFKKLFAEYRTLDAAARPKNDEEKRDQWMVRFSKLVGRNLGPFFQAWGVPTSEKARAEIASLPSWMPDDFAKR